MNKDITREFLETLFSDYLATHKGYIEIREINNGKVRQNFYSSIEELLKDIGKFSGNIYFGVAPRHQEKGDRKSEKYITSLWADIDVGKEGHKKESEYKNSQDALDFIGAFSPKPSVIVHSGNGFHLYWLLKQVVEIKWPEDVGRIENILRGLIKAVKGDTGTGDISRILRLPGTKNCKDPGDPKDVNIYKINPSLKYELKKFEEYEKEGDSILTIIDRQITLGTIPEVTFEDLQNRGVASTILDLIKNGSADGRYRSRSERDQAIITELLIKEFTPEQIISIFRNPNLPVSDRYLELGKRGDRQYKYNIQKAQAFIDTAKIETVKVERRLSVPMKTEDMLNKYNFDNPLEPFEKLEDYRQIDNEHYLIYQRKVNERGRQEIREYHIKKDLVDPGESIPLPEMKDAYLSSIFYATHQHSFIIDFTLSDKLKIIKGTSEISGKKRKVRLLAEKLLANMQFRSMTKKGELIENENYQNLYSGIQIIRENPTSPITLRVTLNPTYLPALNEETGKISGPFLQQTIPFGRLRESKDKYKKRCLRIMERLGRFTPSQPERIPYKVKNLFVKMGIKDWELDRLGICKEIWIGIEPTIRQAGHEIVKREVFEGQDKDDVRNWTLWLKLKDKMGRKTKGKEQQDHQEKLL